MSEQSRKVTVTAIHGCRAGDLLNLNSRIYEVTNVVSHTAFEAFEVLGWRLKWLRTRAYVKAKLAAFWRSLAEKTGKD